MKYRHRHPEALMTIEKGGEGRGGGGRRGGEGEGEMQKDPNNLPVMLGGKEQARD